MFLQIASKADLRPQIDAGTRPTRRHICSTEAFNLLPIDSKRPRVELSDADTMGIDSISSLVQVLQTAELLEAVLFQLTFADLLNAQRVCKKWLHSIQASLLLQRKLFLKPHFKAPKKTMVVKDSGLGLVCGLDLGSIFETYSISVPSPHPLLQNTTIIQLHQDPPRKHVLQNLHHGSYRDLPLRKSGSWERQLIAQPPPTKIKVQCTICNFTGDVAVIEDVGGVRMGPVAQVLREVHEAVREKGRTFEGNVSIVIDIVR